MANDHYVAKTYLKHFAGPDGKLRAYRKSDGASFPCRPDDICKEPDGDIIPDFLSEPAYLGEFRKAFEPLWNSSIASLKAHSVDMRDKLHIAGYWANLLVCTPAWRRVAIEASNQRVSHTVAAYYLLSERMGKADPKIKEAIEAEQCGEIVIETEADYVRAQAAQSVLKYAWGIYNAMWDVYENVSDVPFVTSDNPASIVDQGENNWSLGVPYVRLVPITPKLCLRCDLTLVPEHIREAKPDFEKMPHGGVRGGTVDLETGEKINDWIARCAEDIVLTGAKNDYVRDLTKKNAKFRVVTQSARFPEGKGFLIANRTRVIEQAPI
jgi:Protein of unknown function (DUF4238)